LILRFCKVVKAYQKVNRRFFANHVSSYSNINYGKSKSDWTEYRKAAELAEKPIHLLAAYSVFTKIPIATIRILKAKSFLNCTRNIGTCIIIYC
jgi:hypothetical protein